jgi:hypothetical protein
MFTDELVFITAFGNYFILFFIWLKNKREGNNE